ncbi:hypothetical protein [Pantoea sp. 1.19]|uniref:hypothetical protein n=1 Tax=Pantoea sp. 1.19 TaxID=1925589 RepID=UPI000949121D|nr:hypothetical protein [Pantoea sp. 1.19]
MITRIILLAGLLTGLSGCATLVGSEQDQITVQSTPPGARFVVQDEQGRAVAEGITPQVISLQKSTGRYFGKKAWQVMFEIPGYVPLTVPLEARANLWYVLGNLPLGGLPGWLLVDPWYGGMYTIKPALINPPLHPVGARGG